MQGKSAAIIQPMLQQQQLQRGQLQQQLAGQLGPGWATSSAGIAAMNNFNTQADLSVAQAQMTALNQVSEFLNFGVQSSNAINASDRSGFEANATMSAQILNEQGNIQQRQVNAIEGTSSALQQTAGAGYAGEAAFGSSLAGIGSSMLGIGSTLAGKSLGGAPPSANPIVQGPLQQNGRFAG
jgi:hypothetical protein